MATPNVSELRGRPLGRVLVKMGKVTREQVHEALQVQKEKGGPIGQILIELGYIDQKTCNMALGFQAGMEYVDLKRAEIQPEVLHLIPAQMATTYKVVPLEYDQPTNHLKVAVASANNFHAIDDLRTLMGFNVTAKIADPDDLDAAMAKFFNVDVESIGDLINELAGDEQFSVLENRGESIDLETIKEMADSNPVKKLVNMVLLEAIRNRASDIHFEPFEEEFKMRYRIDGLLYEMLPPPRSIAVAIASRIKVMADLDIAERRLPQDGRIELVVNGSPVDLRVSVLPTMFGESVVMRVLDRSNVSLDMERLGLREDDIRVFRQLIQRPNGIVIVTGPTGSGKSTTLYASMQELEGENLKILTVEDPVEYRLQWLNQVQVQPQIGLTFAKVLRSFLRQDPDVIMIGEMRDGETAEIAVQAALTGHLVMSTLHTNSALGAIVRLINMGVEPYLITASVIGVLAQRLVRKLCEECKQALPADRAQAAASSLGATLPPGQVIYRHVGCSVCRGTGYRGRLAVHELLLMTEGVKKGILERGSSLGGSDGSYAGGNLLQDGATKVFQGLTTAEEVLRVARQND